MAKMIFSDMAKEAIGQSRWLRGQSQNRYSFLRHVQMTVSRRRWKILIFCLGASLVATTVHADFNGVTANVQAQAGQPGVSGADEAMLLNRRYGLTVKSCGVDKPAWYCSGLLMRDITAAANQFWTLNTTENSIQSVAHTYLRKDVPGADTASGPRIGMVLADLPTAVAAGKPYAIRCVYPEEATFKVSDPDYGCNLTGTALSPNPDSNDNSSCAAVGVINASQWKDEYLTTAPTIQCSFNAQLSDPFNQALQANVMVRSSKGGRNVQLQAVAWDTDHPETIAIEALYYSLDGSKPLLPEAQARQLAYYQATGIWLPLLRYQPGADTPFGYDETDQLYYGETVVNRVNARYFDTTDCPNNMAAYMCNGVLLRFTGYSTAYHSWNPSPKAVEHKGVSFVFYRADLHIDLYLLGNQAGGGVGLIHRELAAPAQHPLTMLCVYPSDGATNLRTEKCGTYLGTATSGPCIDQSPPVTDLASWQAQYERTTLVSQCSLGVDKDAFDLSILARSTFTSPPARASEYWNEPVIAVWPENIPAQLPLEAILYIEGRLPGAQYIQRDYFQQTRRFLPILKVNTASGVAPPFAYVPGDQIDSG